MQEERYVSIRRMYRKVGMLLCDIATLILQYPTALQYPTTDRKNEENLTPPQADPDRRHDDKTMPPLSNGSALGTGETMMLGLGLIAEATYLTNCMYYLQQGLCKIYVLGAFNAGKSTLINSLLGMPLFPVAPYPMTAAVTHVVYGSQQQARIYEEGKDQLTSISWSAFTSNFTLPRDHSGMTGAQGKIISPLQHIKYIQVEVPHAPLEYGARLIDTPGLNVQLPRPVVTSHILKPLDTLIMVVLNALQPFPIVVEELLKTLKDASTPEKLFFVVNRCDQVPPQRVSTLKAEIQRKLQPYFVDQHGNFNEPLYQQRVFFVSARDALHARAASSDTSSQAQLPIIELERAIGDYLASKDVYTQSLEPIVRTLDTIAERAYQQIIQQRAALVEDNPDQIFSIKRERHRLDTLEHTLYRLIAQVKMAAIATTAHYAPEQSFLLKQEPLTSTINSANRDIVAHLSNVLHIVERAELEGNVKADLHEKISTLCYKYINPSFSVAVVGEFNSGKSTFINALLREEILKAAAVVATAGAVHIRYGRVPDFSIQFKKYRGPLTYSQDAAILWQLVQFYTQQTYPVSDDMRPCLHALSADDRIATHLEHLTLSYPAAFLANGMTIIDTPGLSAENPEHAQITTTLVKQEADITIVLIPAPFPLSLVLQKFLTEQLFPLSKSYLFVLTQMDKIFETDQRELVIADTFRRLSAMSGIQQPPILASTAARVVLDTVQRREGSEAKTGDYYNRFVELENMLWRYLYGEQERASHQLLKVSWPAIFKQLNTHLSADYSSEGRTLAHDLQEIQQKLSLFQEQEKIC